MAPKWFPVGWNVQSLLVADTQANSEDETEQSSTQPPSGEDKDGDKGEDKGETKGEDNGEDNLNEVLWAGFTQKQRIFIVYGTFGAFEFFL